MRPQIMVGSVVRAVAPRLKLSHILYTPNGQYVAVEERPYAVVMYHDLSLHNFAHSDPRAFRALDTNMSK